jgi:hypothetical protein
MVMYFTYSEEIRSDLRYRYQEFAAVAQVGSWPDPEEPVNTDDIRLRG